MDKNQSCFRTKKSVIYRQNVMLSPKGFPNWGPIDILIGRIGYQSG